MLFHVTTNTVLISIYHGSKKLTISNSYWSEVAKLFFLNYPPKKSTTIKSNIKKYQNRQNLFRSWCFQNWNGFNINNKRVSLDLLFWNLIFRSTKVFFWLLGLLRILNLQQFSLSNEALISNWMDNRWPVLQWRSKVT